MNKQKVKAFTIIEVTITMLITAIVIGITYTSYSIINRSYRSFETKNNDMATIEQLDKLLKRDFLAAKVIRKDSSGLRFIIPGKPVHYEFQPDYIIRISGLTDTFKVKNDGLNMMFEGQNINELSLSEEQNRLDELELNLDYQSEKIPYHYQKQYSSSDLIKKNPNAIN